jgi:hypothetical protein
MIKAAMSDDRPNPLTDVAKGLGLLFRAARTMVGKIPRGDLEAAVVTSAREVGRAIENVASTIERGVRGSGSDKKERPPETPADPKDQPEPPPSSST